MEIFKIGIAGILIGICVLNLKEIKSDIALILSLAGGIIILLFILDYFLEIFAFFNRLISLTGIDNEVVKIMFKIIGVGYVAEFSASIAEESGVKSVADKIILGGKVIILVSSFPIIEMLIKVITDLLL